MKELFCAPLQSILLNGSWRHLWHRRQTIAPRPKSYLPPASRTAQIDKAMVELNSYLRS
jgi:hypothetical protein